MENDFRVLLFAGDINVYSVARAFYDEYGIVAKVYGKYQTFPCANSKIMDYRANYEADQRYVFMDLVQEYAHEHFNQKIILMGCGDSYVQLIADCKKDMPDNIITPTISGDLMRNLTHKEKFYQRCEEFGIPYPQTFVHRKELTGIFELPFEAPFIVKPSNGIEYWNHPFPSQKKVFKCNTREELNSVLALIYEAGYDDSIIIQDFIPGDDTYMRVLTNYSDGKGQVKMMCLGHVLLEEHTPHGIGNHAVIITEKEPKIEKRYKEFLEEIGYIGFSNFDIKYDQRDDEYKVFEINTRQGRSNYYVTGAGTNIAKLVVEDLIMNKSLKLNIVSNQHLWMVVPPKLALKYIKPQEYRDAIKRLIKSKNMSNPLKNKKDRSLKQCFYFLKNYYGHYIKYKKYLS
ncbi:MAG: ATP-grasp domain-containing protein [Anaerovoracaceae bacterium]|jgi:D-aspartate ligase|nr:ATP-grasp domain-containing protein [Anaerovoracaceae bacterium]